MMFDVIHHGRPAALFGRLAHAQSYARYYGGAVARPTLALDRASSVRSKSADGALHVAAANVSCACISPYMGSEIPGCSELGLDPNKVYRLLRDPDALAAAAETFNNLPILSRHVPVYSHDYAAQARQFIIGSTGTDAEYVHPWLRNSLAIWDGAAVALIERDEMRGLSCGYHYTPRVSSGVYDGEPYDILMTEIVGNHLAIVNDPRVSGSVIGDKKGAYHELRTNARA